MIRDGGSLEASFVGSNGSRYGLHFKLISEQGASGEFVRLGYEKPVVFERLEFRQENGFEWQSIGEVEVSWEHAKVLLHQLRSHLRDDEDAKWLEAMHDVANTDGKLPKSIPRSLRPARRLGDA
jgi:hypothetical protein